MSDNLITNYRKIVLLTDGHSDHFFAKTAISLLRYRPKDIVAVFDKAKAGLDAADLFQIGKGVPVIDSFDSVDADALFIGIAPPGGKLPKHWYPIIKEALRNGIDVVSGLHHFLSEDDEFKSLASESGSRLIDVRKNQFSEVGSGDNLPENTIRILTVGQDCSVGKMVTALEIQKEMTKRGIQAGFAASGQTGIMISGSGLPVDCVVSDFVNGAAEEICRQHSSVPYLLVEGQGSLTHPGYSGVTAGLIHGSRPHAMVLCYEAGRAEVKGFPGHKLHSLDRLVELYEYFASLQQPSKVIGVSVNSRLLNDSDFEEEKKKINRELGLPVCDVYRESASCLVDPIVQLKKDLL